MTHQLPPLPFDYDALAPVLSEHAMRLHHDRHHRAYVEKLNKALDGHPELQNVPVEQLLKDLDGLPADLRTPIRNQGGGHANHSLYWSLLAPPDSAELPPSLARELERAFGEVEAFKAKFAETGEKLFGSGYAWLVTDGSRLDVIGLPNQDSPLSIGRTPLLTVDVWEHAYYPDYENRRPEWLQAWWRIVNWEAVAERLQDARPGATAHSGDRPASNLA